MAVVTIANPPANILSRRIRAGLLLAVAETEADRDVRAVVLRGEGDALVGDIDLAGFDGAHPLRPLLSEVVRAVEGTTKPWVAAIDGAAVDAGLELALACHYRVATPAARLALPQVTVGGIPEAGGIVRLCRLADPVSALAIAAEGRPMSGAEALEVGVVDAVFEGDIAAAALAFARDAPRRELPLPLSARRVVGEIEEAFEAAAFRLLARAGGAVAPAEVVAAIREAHALDSHDALAAERRRWLALRGGPQARALRAVLTGERAVAARTGPAPLPSGMVGIVGSGPAASDLATAALHAGRRVLLFDRSDEAVGGGLAAIGANLEASLREGRIDARGRDGIAGRLAGLTDPASLAAADVVIEAVPDDDAIRAETLALLDRAAPAASVLATTASHPDMERLVAVVADPGRVVGLHFPAAPRAATVVEVVRPAGARTSVFETAAALVRDLGKLPIESGVGDGFIGDRVIACLRQAMDILLLEGALPAEIDAALEEFGMATGPYAAEDLSGLDVAWDRNHRMRAREDWVHVPIRARMVEVAQRLGRRTGSGWYDYPAGEASPAPAVAALIREASAQLGIDRRSASRAEIRRRALASMVQEATRILEEGVAKRPADIDLVLVHGHGFPRWRGGPMHWADAEGLKVVAATIDGFAVRDHRTWRVPPLLRRLVAEGRRFADLN